MNTEAHALDLLAERHTKLVSAGLREAHICSDGEHAAQITSGLLTGGTPSLNLTLASQHWGAAIFVNHLELQRIHMVGLVPPHKDAHPYPHVNAPEPAIRAPGGAHIRPAGSGQVQQSVDGLSVIRQHDKLDLGHEIPLI